MNASLSAWIERLLSVAAAGTGQAVRWRLDVTWDLAPWVTLLLLASAATFVAGIYRKESAAAGKRVGTLCALVRCALIAWVLIMLAEPVITVERTGLPSVVVLIDDSASMAIADRYADTELRRWLDREVRAAGLDRFTRLNLAKMLLTKRQGALLATLRKRYRLKVYSMADSVRPHGGDLPRMIDQIRALRPAGRSSRLGSALRTVLADAAGAPPAAIILLTDGITTHGASLSEVAVEAGRKGVPLLTVGLGSAAAAEDVQLADLLVDEVVFVEDVINFQCTVTATGFAGRQVDVVLTLEGKPEVLARTRVQLGDDGAPRTAHLPYRPEREGQFQYMVRVTPLPDEAQTDNNCMKRLVQVRKQKIRVLLLNGYPSYEFRYLKHLFERETTVDLAAVLQDADPEYARQDRSALRSLPADRSEWFAYDVLVIGDADPGRLSEAAMTSIRDFVQQKGGGIVLIAGPQFMPLAYRGTPVAQLLPIQLSTARIDPPALQPADAFPICPTDLGLASPPMQLGETPAETVEIWRAMPPVYWCLDAPDVKPAARVLADSPTPGRGGGRKRPVICLQYVGAGKVLLHATDATWRWRRRQGDTYFGRYWLQSLRYLARSKLLGRGGGAELSTDRREYRRGEPVRLRVRFVDQQLAPAEDDAVTVLIAAKGGRRHHLKLHRSTAWHGIFEGTLLDLGQGSYHASMVAPASAGSVPSANFLVTVPAGESQRVRMDAADLARAAEMTHGKFFTIDTAADLLQRLPAGKQVPVATLPPIVLWNRWWVLVVGLGMLVSEWVMRKRNGLL